MNSPKTIPPFSEPMTDPSIPEIVPVPSPELFGLVRAASGENTRKINGKVVADNPSPLGSPTL
jgi:hypothetical protein